LPAVAGPPARDPAETEAQLGRVQDRIRAVTEAVQADLAARDALAADLRRADGGLAQARQRLEEARARHAESTAREQALRLEVKRLTADLETARAALAAQLRSAYLAGRDAGLKMLLGGSDPIRLPRLMTYSGYLSRARTEQLAALTERAAELGQAEANLATETARLADLEAARRREADAVEMARKERQHALGALQARLNSRGVELQQLKTDAASLEDLLKRLRAAIETPGRGDDFGALGAGRRPFPSLKGRLPWPARGSLVGRFGQPRAGDLPWNGLLLETHRGAEVRAPYHGRVAYADWLPGLGLLLILDHGGGYLSLYGYNGRLLRAVGDRVKPGDAIAESVGDGDPGRPQLYFEIRSAGRPIDPRPWLKGAPRP
jgi:septal ring factor EnvC (AmiA/AmiB activator)